MIKSYIYAVATLALLSGCAADSNNVVDRGDLMESTSSKTIDFGNGAGIRLGRSDLQVHQVFDSNYADNGQESRSTTLSTGNCSGDENHQAHTKLNMKLVDTEVDYQHLTDCFLTNFPERERNLEIEHPDLHEYTCDFTYYSNGEPVTVVPLYTGCRWEPQLYLYYYDENHVYHQQMMWKMTSGWRQGDISQQSGQDLAIITTDGKGITFTLPRDTEFGFFLYNGQNGRHFTNVDENILHAAPNKVPAPNSVSAAQFTYMGYDLIGFEDNFTGDQDYNDLIVALLPHQRVSPRDRKTVEITLGSIDRDFICESDDTNIKVGEVLLPINKIDSTFQLKLKSGDIFSIAFDNIYKYDESFWYPVDDNNDEIVFDIRLYNYNITREEVFQLFGLTDNATLDEFNNDSYNISGVINTTYSYRLNVGITPDCLHLSAIIKRRKN